MSMNLDARRNYDGKIVYKVDDQVIDPANFERFVEYEKLRAIEDQTEEARQLRNSIELHTSAVHELIKAVKGVLTEVRDLRKQDVEPILRKHLDHAVERAADTLGYLKLRAQ